MHSFGNSVDRKNGNFGGNGAADTSESYVINQGQENLNKKKKRTGAVRSVDSTIEKFCVLGSNYEGKDKIIKMV